MSNDTELKEITVWINPDFDEIQMGQIVATTTSEFDFNGVTHVFDKSATTGVNVLVEHIGEDYSEYVAEKSCNGGCYGYDYWKVHRVLSNSQTVNVEQLKTRYRGRNYKYEQTQRKVADALGWTSFYEITPVELKNVDPIYLKKLDPELILELTETYNESREAYWELHEAECMRDDRLDYHFACKKTYDFLDSMAFEESSKWLLSHGLNTLTLTQKLLEDPTFLEEGGLI